MAEVEDFAGTTHPNHNAWDLPFMGYVNEDGYGLRLTCPVPRVVYDPYWDAHRAFLALPKDVQTAFAIRMLFTHRPVDLYGAQHVPALPAWLQREVRRVSARTST